jgi:phosphatidylglycerophosphate synthase
MHERLPLAKSSDGPVSLLLNRHVSTLFSGPLARRGVSPNAATMMALVISFASAAAYLGQVWWLGGVLMQFSSIFSGVDGEIARRTGQSSRYGDFLDTNVDRFAEYLGFAAIAFGLRDAWDEWAFGAGMLALGGTFMLTAASEKYRSAMQENYPKRQLEPLFAYIASGRDVRIFYLMIASILATWNVDILFWAVIVTAVLMHINFVYRVWLLRERM